MRSSRSCGSACRSTEISQLSSERVRDPESALEVAYAFLSRHGFDVQLRVFGETVETTECVIRNGEKAFGGKGKGVAQQSVASAVFEAIEHMHFHEANAKPSLVSRPLEMDGRDAFLAAGSPDFSLFSLDPGVPVSRASFSGVFEAHQVDVPRFLLHHAFVSGNDAEGQFIKRRSLNRYATNSGVASGTTRGEALLHGLLELIERDALGMELLGTVFRRDPYPVRVLRPDTSTDHVHAIVSSAEQESSGVIKLMDLTSDLGIPTTLAHLWVPSTDQHYFGSGASLDRDYSIERAVLEAVQGFHVYTHLMDRPDLSELGNRQSASPYRRCLMEYGRYDYFGGETAVDCRELPSYRLEDARTVEAQVAHIVAQLALNGIDVFCADLLDDDVSVVHVFAPKLERFFLVSAGLMIAPGTRGKSVLEAIGRPTAQW